MRLHHQFNLWTVIQSIFSTPDNNNNKTLPKGKTMHTNNKNTLDLDDTDFFPIDLDETEVIEEEQTFTRKPGSKKIKPHILRRNIEEYLEQKALERRLTDVFDDEFLLD
jgi:hypothetical protein